jgi:hypothetical protein
LFEAVRWGVASILVWFVRCVVVSRVWPFLDVLSFRVLFVLASVSILVCGVLLLVSVFVFARLLLLLVVALKDREHRSEHVSKKVHHKLSKTNKISSIFQSEMEK